MSSDSIAQPRIGIVGLGNIGRFHADNIRETHGRLVGGVDVSREARAAFTERYSVPALNSMDDLFDRSVDGVIVTTPNKFHEDHAIAALERDVPVLVEKPLAHSSASARRIVEAAEASAAFCMVGFHKRFLPAAEALSQRIERGELGDIHHIEANYVRRRGIPGRGGWFTRQAISGGGALIDIGVHALDLALWFTGFVPIQSVNAAILAEFGSRHDYTYLDMYGDDEGPDRFDVEDSVRAFVRTVDRTTIHINVAWAANQPDDTSVTVVGSDGGAHLDHETGELELYTVADHGEAQLLTTGVQTRQTNPHREEQRAFLECIASGTPPTTNTVDQGYTIQRLTEAIYAAGETGNAVSLQDADVSAASAD